MILYLWKISPISFIAIGPEVLFFVAWVSEEVFFSGFGFGFFLAVVFFNCFDIQGGFSWIPLNPEPKNFAHNVQGLSGHLYSYTDLFSGSSFPSSAVVDDMS